eukprot:m.374864 g.374864  ORF g.374864 m.374864 type:complete len:53 (-) comp75013_c0_seq1:220-378(-)
MLFPCETRVLKAASMLNALLRLSKRVYQRADWSHSSHAYVTPPFFFLFFSAQ